MPALHFSYPDGSTKIVDLSTITLPAVIGRDSELAKIVVPDGQVSRAHCVVNRDDGNFLIEDLGSRNGTLLNDKKIAKCPLRHGDLIKVGGTKVRVELQENRDQNDPLVGKRLGGFDLHSVLGKGRFGVVYRGVQVALSRPVAIKVLSDEYRSDPAKVQAFLTEARRAGRLNHPNLVQVHDVCQIDENYLLIMELMKCSAMDQLEAQGALPESQVLKLLSDIAKALGYAESQRLVHRDVKPDNILVNEEGTYKLADLGIATPIAANGVAHQERIFGSPHYVAPEQAKGGTIDGRADLYALGATAWHLLTNKPVFEGTSRQVVAAHLNAEVPDLEALAPQTSESLIELVYELLEKEPDDRPANAAEVVKRIEEVHKSAAKEAVASRPRVRRRIVRRRRRR